MTTLKELSDVVRLGIEDKTSGKRMSEMVKVLRTTKVLREPSPEAAVKTAEMLGPTYVKIGQIASNRSDLLPEEYCEALSKLRSRVPAMPFEQVQELLDKAFGKPWREVFSSLDEHPLGSASIAQVHKATLHDGTVVAVKIRRPGITEVMTADIMLMRRVLATAEFMTPAMQMLRNVGNLINELERITMEELDFRVELENLMRFYRDTQDQVGIGSPLPFPQYSTSEVLVMEFVAGFSGTDKEAARVAGVDLSVIGERIVESYVTQVIDKGFFHADPHPGNIQVCNGQAVWIDLGMVGRLSAGERNCVGRMFLAIAGNNVYDLKEALLTIARPAGEVNHGALLEDMEAMLARYGGGSVEDLNVGQAFVDMTAMLHDHNIILPSAFTMLGRGFLTLEGVLEDIAPQVGLVNVIAEHVQSQLATERSAREKAKALLLNSLASVEASSRLPKQAAGTLDMLQKGQLGFDANINVSKHLLGSMYTMVGRVSLALIAAALFIGSAMMTTASSAGPELLDIPVISYFGFLGSFVLSVYVIFTTIRTRHQIRNDLEIT